MRILTLVCLMLAAAPAHAGPVVAAISTIVGGISSFAAASTFGAFVVQTGLSLGVSAVARAVKGKSATAASGIVTETTTSGGTTPQKFILGRYATAGQLIAPPATRDGDSPNERLYYVIALSAVPGVSLLSVIVDDVNVVPGADDGVWGNALGGDLAGHAWIAWTDGHQSYADPRLAVPLVSALGSDPDRPWLGDMVGPGTAYAALLFKYNREVFKSLPSVRFVVAGVPLYDPRQDSTAGGTGTHRWGEPLTWTQTDNPVVMIYNILRGIRLPDGQVWGGEAMAEDLLLSTWVAAMNECDMAIPTATGGSEPQYRAGYEVAVDMAPADVIDELLKTCQGQICEIGGTWTIRCGAPGMPVLTITDEDVIASSAEEFAPFPGLSETYNGVSATYPEPAQLWSSSEAPPRLSSAWEAEDGGRRLMAELSLSACPYPAQVQRLMGQGIADHRRWRAHRLTLPPDAAILSPLDSIAWTSTRNGYTTKVFEVTGLTDHLTTFSQTITLRERDSGDYSWTPGAYLAAPRASAIKAAPVSQAVPGLSVFGSTITDGGVDRRPAITIAWTATGAIDARGVIYEVRRAGSSEVKPGSHGAISTGFVRVTEGLLPGTAYEVRARLIMDRAAAWSVWVPVTTPDVRLGLVDLNGSRRQLVLPGEYPIYDISGPYTVTEFNVGTLSRGGLWTWAVVFDARRVPYQDPITISLDCRWSYGGVMEPWRQVQSWPVSEFVWRRFTSAGTIGGGVEGFQYRITADSNDDHINGLRDLYITVVNVAE